MKSPLYEISNDGKILTLTSNAGKDVELTIEAVSIEVITWSDDAVFDIDVLNLPNVMGEVTVEGMRDRNKRIGSIFTRRDLAMRTILNAPRNGSFGRATPTKTTDEIMAEIDHPRQMTISPMNGDFEGDEVHSPTVLCIPLLSLPNYIKLSTIIKSRLEAGGDINALINYLRFDGYEVIGELNTLVVKLKVPTGYMAIVINIVTKTNIKLVGAIDRLSDDYCIDFCTSMKLHGNTLLISSECKPVNQVQVFKLYGEVESIKLLATEELKHKFKTVRNVLPSIDDELAYLADSGNMVHEGNYYDCTATKSNSVSRIIEELKSKSIYGIGVDIVEELTNLLAKPTKDAKYLPSVTPNLPMDMVNELTGLLPNGCTLRRSKVIHDKSGLYEYISDYQEAEVSQCSYKDSRLHTFLLGNTTYTYLRNSDGYTTRQVILNNTSGKISYMDITYDNLNRVHATKYHDVLTGKDTRIVYEYIYVDNILFVLESQDGTSISGISTIVEYH